MHHYETELNRLRAEYAGLSGTKRVDMDQLLMEGDLLEVTMDEVQQLWLVLHQDAETLTVFERFGMEDDEGGERGKEEEGRRRRKRKVPSVSVSVSSGGGDSVGTSSEVASRLSKVPPSKRQKRVTRSTTPKSSPSPAPSNSSSHSKYFSVAELACPEV